MRVSALGMFEPPRLVPWASIPMSVVDSAEHRALAREAAAKSVVLLQNRKATIPIDLTDRRKQHIAVIGPNANRTASLLSNYAGCRDIPGGPVDATCRLVTPLAGISAAAAAAAKNGATVEFAQGCEIDTNSTAGFAQALSAAARADVVVVVLGLITCQEQGPQCQEAEAHDRVSIGLPGQQLNLLQQLVKSTAGSGAAELVLVLMSGSGVSVPFAAQNVDTIIQHFYPGEEGGNGLADILFGATAPAGRMPVSVPARPSQLAPYLDMHMDHKPGRTHRYFDSTSAGEMLFPFGFGMATTNFEYSALSVNMTDRVVVASVKLKNTGNRTSDEVCQVYTSLGTNRSLAASPPLQDLQAFQRVTQVAPGKSVSLVFEVPFAQLQLMDATGKLRVLPGTYAIWVGGRAPTGEERRRDSGRFHSMIVQQAAPSPQPPVGTPHQPLSASFHIGANSADNDDGQIQMV